MPRAKILGTPVDYLTRAEVIAQLDSYLKTNTTHFIVTANAEMYYQAQSDQGLQAAIASADLIVPDSVGIGLALRWQGKKTDIFPGIELAEYLLAKKMPVYVLGTKPEVLVKLNQSNIIGKSHGFFTVQEESQILADIKQKQPQVLFVALGVGKQECWIARYKHLLNVPIIIGVGGAVDVLAGFKRRAPLFFRNLKLEWFYRLITEPKRIFRQYVLVLYWLAVLKESKCSVSTLSK